MTKREVILTYPLFDNEGRDLAPYVEQACTAITRRYGGCTSVDAMGYWENANKDIQHEYVRRIHVSIGSGEQEMQLIDDFKIDMKFFGQFAAYYIDTEGEAHVEILD